MNQMSTTGVVVARALMSVVFILNGLGIIDQTIPAKELMEHGAPAGLVPLIMLSGRVLELIAGVALAMGILPRLSAVALLAFLIPATLISHSFWQAAGTPAFMGQLINFSKNMAICAGLLFIASNPLQPTLVSFNKIRSKRLVATTASSA